MLDYRDRQNSIKIEESVKFPPARMVMWIRTLLVPGQFGFTDRNGCDWTLGRRLVDLAYLAEQMKSCYACSKPLLLYNTELVLLLLSFMSILYIGCACGMTNPQLIQLAPVRHIALLLSPTEECQFMI